MSLTRRTVLLLLSTLVDLLPASMAWASDSKIIRCEGVYPHHLQGVCADDKALYWSFTTTLVKTDWQGKRLISIPVANHHGDLCEHDGKLYVAVNLGKFNHPEGHADSWVYVYDVQTLEEEARHEVQQVFHGAGGIGFHDGHFYVVGGLPNQYHENYIYEYDDQFQFIKRIELKSCHTLLGIQTATFAHDRWWFGCYGSPAILLVADKDFQFLGRYPFNCSLGIERFQDGQMLSASGICEKGKGCTGKIQIAVPDVEKGLRLLTPDKKGE